VLWGYGCLGPSHCAHRRHIGSQEDKAALLSAARDREAEVARLTEELSLRDGELGQAAQRIDTLQVGRGALYFVLIATGVRATSYPPYLPLL
jgi:hypothetical protein